MRRVSEIDYRQFEMFPEDAIAPDLEEIQTIQALESPKVLSSSRRIKTNPRKRATMHKRNR
jgi:hypothetical protein